MFAFDHPHAHSAADALARLLAAAPAEGIEVLWPDGPPGPDAPASGEVVAPSPLGPVRARFTIHPDHIAIAVLEAPRLVPDFLVRSAMEEKIDRALGRPA